MAGGGQDPRVYGCLDGCAGVLAQLACSLRNGWLMVSLAAYKAHSLTRTSLPACTLTIPADLDTRMTVILPWACPACCVRGLMYAMMGAAAALYYVLRTLPPVLGWWCPGLANAPSVYILVNVLYTPSTRWEMPRWRSCVLCWCVVWMTAGGGWS